MSETLLFVIAAITAFVFSGINPAIILSKLIYHRDIREEGSKNPGFTNFRRVFGNRYAWFVFALDILKSVIFRDMKITSQQKPARRCFHRLLCHAWPLLPDLVSPEGRKRLSCVCRHDLDG